MTYAHPQDPQDAFEAERWHADPKLFRDARFDNGRWIGPASVLAGIPLELTVNTDE
jgi:hypothetical protein